MTAGTPPRRGATCGGSSRASPTRCSTSGVRASSSPRSSSRRRAPAQRKISCSSGGGIGVRLRGPRRRRCSSSSLFWDTHRIAALCGVTLVYAADRSRGALAPVRAPKAERRRSRRRWPSSSGTARRSRAGSGTANSPEGASERHGESKPRRARRRSSRTRAELDRQRVVLAVHEVKSIVSPLGRRSRRDARGRSRDRDRDRGAVRRTDRLWRWLRYASFGLVALRLARSWRAKPR